jgi:hypothetical protein
MLATGEHECFMLTVRLLLLNSEWLLNSIVVKVANLEIKTKDLAKDSVSLQSTNARLAVTRRLICEAKLNHA